jgi:hypothetical protein
LVVVGITIQLEHGVIKIYAITVGYQINGFFDESNDIEFLTDLGSAVHLLLALKKYIPAVFGIIGILKLLDLF